MGVSAAVVGAAATAKGAHDQNKAAKQANEQAAQGAKDQRNAMAASSEEAKRLSMPLMAQSEQNKWMGQQAALDVLGQSVPQQLSAFQQGGNNAMSAILGGGITPISYDASFLQQQLPEYTNIQQSLGGSFSSPVGSVFQAPDASALFQGMTNADVLAGAGDMAGLSSGAREWLPRWGREMSTAQPGWAQAGGFAEDPSLALAKIIQTKGPRLGDKNQGYASELLRALGGTL